MPTRVAITAKIVSFNMLVYGVTAANANFAPHKHVELRTQNDLGDPVLPSDEFRIKQVLDNLVGNALKFDHSARSDGVGYT